MKTGLRIPGQARTAGESQTPARVSVLGRASVLQREANPAEAAKPDRSATWPEGHSAHERPEPAPPARLEPPAIRDSSGVRVRPAPPGTLQARLATSVPGDAYEQEADRISAAVAGSSHADEVQAAATPFERAKRSGANIPVTTGPGVPAVTGSSGQPLDASASALMESRFGHDFSSVRIHADAPAAASARTMNARAYTVGPHVVFGEGQYAPATPAGQRLLAHELTHVLQQRAGAGAGLAMRDKAPDAGVPAPAAPAPSAARASLDGSSLWFQDPKVAGDPKQPDRQRVFTENALSQVGTLNVRFAYPLSDLVPTGGDTNGPSPQVVAAKTQILTLLSKVIVDLGSYPGGTADQVRSSQVDRARLKEAYTGFSASKPLNIFIATLDSPSELMTGKYVPSTDQVYIDINDVGNESKLEAAIRLPLQNLKGGTTAGTGQRTPAQSDDELKKTLLHEALHAMLIRKGVGSDALWAKFKAQSRVTGPPSVQAKGEELVRKFQIAQEEVFVYTSVAQLYPPVDQVKDAYDIFLHATERLLKKKGSTLQTLSLPITVSEKVEKKPVTWTVAYSQPGSFTLTDADLPVLNLILTTWPA